MRIRVYSRSDGLARGYAMVVARRGTPTTVFRVHLSFLLLILMGPVGWVDAASIHRISSPPERAADSGTILEIEAPAATRYLSLSDIESLPIYSTTLETGWGMSGTFQGVKLARLLRHCGIPGAAGVRLTALDEYSVSLDRASMERYTPLLVTRWNGRPLKRSQWGPLVLMWPSRAESVLEGTAPMATWIWSVRRIAVVRQ